MKYARIWRYIADTPWAILPGKLDAIVLFMTARSAGLSALEEDLAAFTGRDSPQSSARGSLAILPMRGVIAHRAGMLEDSSGGVSTETFAKAYRQLMADPNISTILLDVDSPGGTVAGIHELALEMIALRGTKKVVAIANSTMASAAYWLCAAAADEIVAIPSATVGSIGVASVYVNPAKQLEMEGVELEVFTSAEHKVDSLGLGPLSDDAKARRKARVDEAGAWFRSDIAKGRGLTVAQVRSQFGEGAIFGATDGKAAGLVDRIATFEDTVARLLGKSGARAGGMRAEGDDPALEALVPSEEDAALLAAANAAAEEDLRRRFERF